MARYIDADKLLEELQEEIEFETTMYTEEQNKWFNIGLKCAVRDVKSQPTADVAEIPCRCAECKYYCANYCTRDIKGRTNMFYMTETDFCSYGEKRTDNDVSRLHT